VNLSVLQPEGWPKPRGYANGIAAHGRCIFVAGQIGWNANGEFESDDLIDQVRQALRNIVAVLGAAGAEPRHIVRLTWFITDKRAYLADLPRLGEAYRSAIGSHYPAMSVVEVKSLLEDRARVEIEATAVLPDA
jgi:enamine deaminase RidA (YjgF/YER057c/UK114 family)